MRPENPDFPEKGRLYISPGAILLLAFLIWADYGELLIYTLAAVSVHESGHLMAMAWYGCQAERVSITPTGFEIRRKPGRSLSYGQEVFVRLAGPAAGGAAAFLFAWLASYIGDGGFYTLSGASLVLSLVNLLPVRQTDGGQALYFFLCACDRAGPDAADRAISALNLLLGMAITGLGGIVFFFANGNLTLFLIGLSILSEGRKSEAFDKRRGIGYNHQKRRPSAAAAGNRSRG